MSTQHLNGDYYKVPNDIYKICHNAYELAILTHLLQRQNTDGECFPGISTLQQGIMAKPTVLKALNRLDDIGAISIVRQRGKVNHYVVNTDKVLELIHQSTTLTSQPHLPVNHIDTTSKPHLPLPVNHIDTNNTHINNTHLTKPITLKGQKQVLPSLKHKKTKYDHMIKRGDEDE